MSTKSNQLIRLDISQNTKIGREGVSLMTNNLFGLTCLGISTSSNELRRHYNRRAWGNGYCSWAVAAGDFVHQ